MDGDRRLDRRRFLELAAGTAGTAGAALLTGWHPGGAAGASTIARAASTAPAGSDLGAIEHVIFLMMENRSFDHYFGTYPGVRGFDDHPPDSLGAFSQRYPHNTDRPPLHRQLPFHLDTLHTDRADCTFDLLHDWGTQHRCWHGGDMKRFVETHTSSYEGDAHGVLTMGYYRRADLPYYYALADAFTIGDGYHCSVLGPTDPNRCMQMSGTIDPSGRHGGPVLVTNGQPDAFWELTWTTMPEVLQDHGISWKYYRPAGNLYSIRSMEKLGIVYDTVLPYFAAFQSSTSELHRRAFGQTFPDTFLADLAAHRLPKVSWISAPIGYDDHPPAPPALGMWFTNQVLQALVSEPEVWSRTVLFLMYDENDGFFDHVEPPHPPPGTPGEYVTVEPLPFDAGGIAGPIGLGVRVPLLVLSPFSRGGYVCSETFDHTSQLRFLEERFGVRCPHISQWRRRTVGDLTGTLRLGAPDLTIPSLPATSDDTSKLEAAGCSPGQLLGSNSNTPPYPLPKVQHMPTQEPGTRPHVP